ncbi:hypothetical protein ERX55_10480 [Macrococcus bovicus]|uniref:Uncharacterized protein n=2 Tax=Macrococcus bovicus TaxID=69968 RepID=A0A4R6BW65_9STAP|nr:hypothetical protein ERX55_10480 [Macrococcus bovicus]
MNLEKELLSYWDKQGVDLIYKYKHQIHWYRSHREGRVNIKLFNDLTQTMFKEITDIASVDGYVEDGYAVSVKELLERLGHQRQRADELEKENDILKHNIRVELDSSRNMFSRMCKEKQRADEAEKRADAAEGKWEELKALLDEEISYNATSLRALFAQQWLVEMQNLERGEE